MNAVTWAVLAYVAGSLAIGAFVSRRIKTEDDYLVAGRSLGYGLATFSVFATWFGAETCLGAAGSIYSDGLSGGSADPFGYGLCLLVMGAVFAVPLWRMKLTTLVDVFARRYGKGVERLAVVFMVPTSLLWAAAQIRAFGQVLSVTSGFEVTLTISFAALVVIAYTMFGGLLADAWTDLVQGVALIVGLAVLWVSVMRAGGAEMLAAVEPERLALLGPPGTSLWDAAEAWAIPLCGSVLAAELVARVIACKSPQVARRSSLIAGSAYLLVGLIPVTLGLVGAALLPGLEDGEQLLPRLAQEYLPTALYAVFAGALVSAILSTVDSVLLVASSMVSHNVIVSLRPDIGEAAKVRLARGGVALFGVLAYVIALHAEGVYALVEEASAFGSAGLFVVLVFGIFTRWGGTPAACLTMVAGMLVWILGAYVLKWQHPFLLSLAASLAAYGVGAVLEPRPRTTAAG